MPRFDLLLKYTHVNTGKVILQFLLLLGDTCNSRGKFGLQQLYKENNVNRECR